MLTLSIVFEHNGSDVTDVSFAELLSAEQLLTVVQAIADANEIDMSEINMRFAWKGDNDERSTKIQAVD